MKRSNAYVLIALTGSLPLGVLAANLTSAAPRASAQATPAASASPALLASPKAAEVVDAADAFLATLSEEQRAIAQIELKPELAIRWTNFPGGSNVRNGVFYRELKPEQVQAALKVAQVALGEEGFARYQEVRAADDAFAKGGRGGRGPGGPGGPAQKKAGGDPGESRRFVHSTSSCARSVRARRSRGRPSPARSAGRDVRPRWALATSRDCISDPVGNGDAFS